MGALFFHHWVAKLSSVVITITMQRKLDDDDDNVIASFCRIIVFIDCIVGYMGRCIDVYKCFWQEIVLPLTLGSIF